MIEDYPYTDEQREGIYARKRHKRQVARSIEHDRTVAMFQRSAFRVALEDRPCRQHSADAGTPCWGWPTASGQVRAVCGRRLGVAR